jgi:hypothetical protein
MCCRVVYVGRHVPLNRRRLGCCVLAADRIFMYKCLQLWMRVQQCTLLCWLFWHRVLWRVVCQSRHAVCMSDSVEQA